MTKLVAMSAINKQDCDVTGSVDNLWESLSVAEWKKIAVILLIILAGSVYHNRSLLELREIFGSNEVGEIQRKIERAYKELHTLKEEHAFLVEKLQSMHRSIGPFIDYETTRRRILSNTKDLWQYISYHLKEALNATAAKSDLRQKILNGVVERKRSLISNIEKLPTVDGYQKWRHNEAGSVSDLIQRRLQYLQNPADCKQAKKLMCEVTTCGLGCQQHHLAYCLIYAYATERTLIIRSFNWKNLAENKMQAQLFHFFSKTCNDIYNDTVRPWSAASLHSKVLSLPTLHDLQEPVFPKFLPIYLPKDLARRIVRFNAEPSAWWVGQMLKYILKPRKEAQRVIHNNLLAIDFKSPTVGLHIRRTDKLDCEAKSHDLKEYMSHVEDFYEQIEQYTRVTDRRVYIATDEPDVLREAIVLYPKYKFYSNYTIAKWAGLDSRMYPEAMMGTLLDIHMLAICDYVICTFSSNIGRMVYELVQTYRLDAYTGFTSLDRYYYFTQTEPHLRIAVMNNRKNGTLEFNVGDLIQLVNQDINCIGIEMQSSRKGPFPWYKTIPLAACYPFPEYKQVEVYADKRLPV